MWKGLQCGLEPIAEEQRPVIEQQLRDIVRDCTDEFFQFWQNSVLSPPATPFPPEEQKPVASEAAMLLNTNPPFSALIQNHYVPPQSDLSERLNPDHLSSSEPSGSAVYQPSDEFSLTTFGLNLTSEIEACGPIQRTNNESDQIHTSYSSMSMDSYNCSAIVNPYSNSGITGSKNATKLIHSDFTVLDRAPAGIDEYHEVGYDDIISSMGSIRSDHAGFSFPFS